VLEHSKGRIDRAGDALRAHAEGAIPLSPDELRAELRIVEAFRAAHRGPLRAVAANLRYYVAEASGGTFLVGQRLKRIDTIRDKLTREPTMALSRMHDIGGCRAVLTNQKAVDAVVDRLRVQRRWDLLDRTWDYVANPKPDGYRATHLVRRKDSVLVEIQLRTALQHEWAELVEALDRRLGTGLKTGRAEPEIRDLLVLASTVTAAYERGEFNPAQVVAALEPVLRSIVSAADKSKK